MVVSTSSHMKYNSWLGAPSEGCMASSAGGSLKINHPPPASTLGCSRTSAKNARSASGSLLYKMMWLPLITARRYAATRCARQVQRGVGAATSGGEDDLVLLQARQAVVPRVLARLADVHQQEGLQRAAREEVVIERVGVEATHRAGDEAGGADAEEEVADLQRGVEPRGLLASNVVREGALGAREVRERAGQVFVEVGVGGQDRHDGGVRGLVPVAIRHVLQQALPRRSLPDDDDPQRLGVHRRRCVLDEVIDRRDLVVGDGLVREGVRRASVAEEQVLGVGGESERCVDGRSTLVEYLTIPFA